MEQQTEISTLEVEKSTLEIIEDNGNRRRRGRPAAGNGRRLYGGGSLIQKDGCRNWIAVYYQNGRQIQRSTGTPSKMRAEAKLREYTGKAAAGSSVPSSRLKYEELREALIADYRRKGNKTLIERKAEDGSIIYSVNMGLGHLDKFFAGVSVTKIRPKVLDQYVAQRREAGAEPSTINRELAMLRRMFKLAVQQEVIAQNQSPAYWPMLKENEPRTGFFERDDFERLLAELPDYVQPLAMFLYWTGCRVGAAQSTTWDQIDLVKGLIRLEGRQTKNKEPLWLPLPDDLLAVLRAVPEDKRVGPVFYTGQFRKSWHSACEKLGLGHWETKASGRRVFTAIVHDFRRTAARNLIEAGIDRDHVMKITGHKTDAMLRRYNIVNTKQLSNAMAKVQAHVLNGDGRQGT